ncbi:fimbrial biogenesis usher protein [Enterobacteriaceae bacterium G50]|nr:fimbrial biogenesis usher protein [Enterobacteriaceae bacterium G50]
MTPLALALAIPFSPGMAFAENYFNPAFFSDDPSTVSDLSRFTGSEQAPGTYRVDVFLNGQVVSNQDVTFVNGSDKGNTGLMPCLNIAWLQKLGVNITAFPGLAALSSDACVDIEKEIPDASTHFNFEKLQLQISIPQAALNQYARGYIPPERWDNGITALMLDYNFTGSNSKNRSADNHSTNDNYFLSLKSGLNMGPWRLRDRSTWNYSGGGEQKWEHLDTYIERSIISLKSILTLGDTYTNGDVFDSQSLRGVQLASDDNMLPDSLRGFAPTIRGIAKSNAQVTIKQNGYVLYQAYVPTGAFEISDLYPTSSSGDLTVEVKESDGSVNAFVVPYSSVPLLQREGRLKYALAAGEYRSNSDEKDNIDYGQATFSLGLPKGITVYGGAQGSNNYSAGAVGVGVNLGTLGAVSADVTYAKSKLADDSEHTGQSLRFLYAKSLNDWGTNFQLLGYRYSTSGFYTMADTAYKTMSGNDMTGADEDTPLWMTHYDLYYTKRGKFQVNISQQFGDYGSVYLTGSQQTYWHTDEKQTLVQIGYNATLKDVNYGLSYNYNKAPGQPGSDRILAFNITVPLGRWLSASGTTYNSNNTNATYSVSQDDDGTTRHNAGINGTLLAGNNLSYSVQESYDSQEKQTGGNVNLNYRGTYGNGVVGYNYANNGDYQQINYGLSGGIVVHQNGITLSQPLGDTNVLVAAEGASDVGLLNNTGVRTDWRGYAVIPYASSYRENRIALDVNSMDEHMEVDEAAVNVVPTRGALVRASFKARAGARALMALSYHHRAVPFGAVVTFAEGNASSIVDDDGLVYLAGLEQKGTLHVKWGEGAEQQCSASWLLTDEQMKEAIIRLSKECE